MIVSREKMQEAHRTAKRRGVFGFSPEMKMACILVHDVAARGYAHQGKLGDARACDEVIDQMITRLDP